jgi:hypothetical protein
VKIDRSHRRCEQAIHMPNTLRNCAAAYRHFTRPSDAIPVAMVAAAFSNRVTGGIAASLAFGLLCWLLVGPWTS